eukprot:2249918-Rhodomonas_salina.2
MSGTEAAYGATRRGSNTAEPGGSDQPGRVLRHRVLHQRSAVSGTDIQAVVLPGVQAGAAAERVAAYPPAIKHHGKLAPYSLCQACGELCLISHSLVEPGTEVALVTCRFQGNQRVRGGRNISYRDLESQRRFRGWAAKVCVAPSKKESAW